MRYFLIILLAVMLSGWIHPVKSSPFQRPTVTKASGSGIGVIDRFREWLNKAQRDLRQAVAAMARDFKKQKSALILLLIGSGSFIYGVIHAIGPGHGKTIVMSYMLYEKNPSLSRGLLAGFVVAFGEAVSAILVVYSIYYLALGRITSSFQQAEGKIRTVSYTLILILGVILFAFRLFNLITRRDTKSVEHEKKRFKGLSVVVLLGLIPCPGVMLLLIFMLAVGLPIYGVLFALCMALGMTLTISGFSMLTVVSKSWFVKLVSKRSQTGQRLQTIVELSGAIAIVSIAGILLLSR